MRSRESWEAREETRRLHVALAAVNARLDEMQRQFDVLALNLALIECPQFVPQKRDGLVEVTRPC
jgi:hypothetical protein